MGEHEKFLELCASATAGELTSEERTKLDVHLALCEECRRAMHEYEIAAQHVIAALASEFVPVGNESNSWAMAQTERALFKRLESEKKSAKSVAHGNANPLEHGRRFTYRPSLTRWSEVWMPLASAALLALALCIAAYRTGVKRRTDVARTTSEPAKDSAASLEEQVSDAGHERAQLMVKLAKEDKVIADLRRHLSQQEKSISALRAAHGAMSIPSTAQSSTLSPGDAARREEELAAESKVLELQKTIEALTGQCDEAASRAANLEAKVGELTEFVRDRERALDQQEEQVAKQQELLEHDRDIRELMGARDLYIAEVHDVSGTVQTDKTYGRVFYTRGKRLIFYAYDLDAQPGIRNASSFQAWGRRGPDKQQALNLGILYEDNVGKKRWVLKANDPKTLEDIDAVFVTIEPPGGSHHPRGKQLLFAYLRVGSNHP